MPFTFSKKFDHKYFRLRILWDVYTLPRSRLRETTLTYSPYLSFLNYMYIYFLNYSRAKPDVKSNFKTTVQKIPIYM